MQTKSNWSLLLPGILAAALAGCGGNDTGSDSGIQTGQAGEHDAHDDAYDDGKEIGSLAAALTLIESEFQEIEDAIAARDIAKADAPVHEVGHILEQVKDMVDESQLTAAQEADVQGALDELFSAFGALDKQIHAGEVVQFSDQQSKIRAAIDRFRSALPKQE